MRSDHLLNAKLIRLGLQLPPRPVPVGSYRLVVLTGGFAYVSGQISKDAEGKLITGKVGSEISLKEGKRAAQWAALQAISVIQAEIGLDRVNQMVRLGGFVQSANDFFDQSEVMNAASELLIEVFGDRGHHVRTAVGVASLPLNAAVELDLVLRVK